MKIKHPLPFFLAIIIYVGFQGFAWTSTWYLETIDTFAHRDIANVVFFACMGIVCLSIDCGESYSVGLKIAAVVMFLLCLLNIFFLYIELTGALLPSGPPAEFDDFGNPIIPEIDGFDDLQDYIDQRNNK